MIECQSLSCGAKVYRETEGEYWRGNQSHLLNQMEEALTRRAYDDLKDLAARVKHINSQDLAANFYEALAIKKLHNNLRPYKDFLSTRTIADAGDFKTIFELVLAHAEYGEQQEVAIFINNAPWTIEKEPLHRRLSDAISGAKNQAEQYGPHPRDIFICYSSTDTAYVEQVVARLEKEEGWTCWYAERNNPPDAHNYMDRIFDMIEKCKVFLLFSSSNAMYSRNVQEEISKALALEKKRVELKVGDLPDWERTTLFNTFSYNHRWVDAFYHGVVNWDRAVKELKIRIGELLYEKVKPTAANERSPEPPVERKLTAVRALIDIVGPKTTVFILVCLVIITMGSPVFSFGRAVYGRFISANAQPAGVTQVIQPEPEESTMIPPAITPTNPPITVIGEPAPDNAAGQYDLGARYLHGMGRPQDYYMAYYRFQKAAVLGHASAQVNLAYLYFHGLGTLQCYEQAVYWYRHASDQGDPGGQNYLGTMYLDGLGVEADNYRATSLFRLSAGQGYAAGQNNLGASYSFGRGVGQSDERALYWFRRAAGLGHAGAQTNLGILLRDGRGTPRDDMVAVYWFRRAAGQGHMSAQVSLASMYELGRGTPQDSVQAAYWFRHAATQGHAGMQNNMGILHRQGNHVEQCYETALYWFRQAAEQDYPGAKINLGTMYYLGQGQNMNAERAVYWYRRAADMGYPPGQSNLGLMYFRGVGAPQSDEQAVYWYRAAAEQGHIAATVNLGWMYEHGRGVDAQNSVVAAYWYRAAAMLGSPAGMHNIANMYETGRGVEQSLEQAIYWYRKAAEAGNAGAASALARLGAS